MKSPQLQALNRVLSRARRDPRQKPEDVETLEAVLAAMIAGKDVKKVWGVQRRKGRQRDPVIRARNFERAWDMAHLVQDGLTARDAAAVLEELPETGASAVHLQRLYRQHKKMVTYLVEEDAIPIPPEVLQDKPSAKDDFRK